MIWPQAGSSLTIWMLAIGKTSYYQEFGLPSLFLATIRLDDTAHRHYGNKCWFFNLFFSKATLRGHLLPSWRKRSFTLEGDLFFAKFQESVWNWIKFVPSYRNCTFIRTAMERFLVMLLFRFFNIFTSSYLEGILSGSGVNLELAKVSVPSLNNFLKLGPVPPSERRT